MVMLGAATVEGAGTAAELTAPALCPQEMRSARRPTSGLSSTQVSSTTRFHRALALGRQASPFLTPYGWEEAAGRLAGRPDAQCCCHCVLPGTAQDLPPAALPHLEGAGAGGTDTCTSQPGAATPTTGQKTVPTSPGLRHTGRVQEVLHPPPLHPFPSQLNPNSHSPLQPWSSHPTALPQLTPSAGPGANHPHRAPGAPCPPGMVQVSLPTALSRVAPTPSLCCNFISSIKF